MSTVTITVQTNVRRAELGRMINEANLFFRSHNDGYDPSIGDSMMTRVVSIDVDGQHFAVSENYS